MAGVTFEELNARGSVAGYTPAHETSQHDTARHEYPLALVAPAAATLRIHPDDAAPREVAAGGHVRAANARGAFCAVADVSDRIRPGVVASTKGRWPGGSKEGATVNAVDDRDSDMGGARSITTTARASTASARR